MKLSRLDPTLHHSTALHSLTPLTCIQVLIAFPTMRGTSTPLIVVINTPCVCGRQLRISQVDSTVTKAGRVTGGDTNSNPSTPSGIGASITTPTGQPLWSASDITKVGQNLDWPSPTTAVAYALKDYPRFFAPEWGPTPIPADQQSKVDPALLPTNGFDYRNNVDGDTYVFLLGSTLDSWFDARRELVTLAGPTPVIPDWAFGTW